MSRLPVALLLVAALVGCSGGAKRSATEAPARAPKVAANPAADLIFTNAVVWTAAENAPLAEAVAIRGSRFLAVGSRGEVLAHRGSDTRVIDVDGAFIVPGFNDNHVHFAQAAAFLEFNVMSVGTQAEFAERVREAVTRIPRGEWILGGFWGAYDRWSRGSAGGAGRSPFAPDLRALDEATRDHPMFLRKFDDREFAANKAALRAAGIDPEAPVAQGITFLPGGRMTGDGVLPRFEKVVPAKFSHQRRVAQTRRALGEIRRHGVTNVSDMSDDEQLAIFRELRAAGELTVRVHFRPHLERVRELADSGVRVGSGDAWIRLGAVKGHIDGIMGNSTARFFAPYSNEPTNRGRWRRLMVDDRGELVPGKFLRYMLAADDAGIQLTVHAIGDEANHLLLDYLEELEKRNGRRDRRFRLVHAQVMTPQDIVRFGKLGGVAEVQPFHLADDMRWMEERIGRERCGGAYAFRSILDAGAVLSFGTDWPGTAAAEYPINPMLGLYAAVTRQTVTGEPATGWFPEERITVEQALRAYTLGTAYANFEDDDKGSIAPGKLADLAVLSQNLLEIEPARMLATNVHYTVVDGRIVYTAPSIAAAANR